MLLTIAIAHFHSLAEVIDNSSAMAKLIKNWLKRGVGLIKSAGSSVNNLRNSGAGFDMASGGTEINLHPVKKIKKA